MNRGSSQARFSSDLSTRTGHEAIVAHCENEIKFLEHMKDFMVKRAKVESDYATALSKLLLSASKFHIPNDYESPIKKVNAKSNIQYWISVSARLPYGPSALRSSEHCTSVARDCRNLLSTAWYLEAGWCWWDFLIRDSVLERSTSHANASCSPYLWKASVIGLLCYGSTQYYLWAVFVDDVFIVLRKSYWRFSRLFTKLCTL